MQVLYSPDIPELSPTQCELLEQLAGDITAVHPVVGGQVQLIFTDDAHMRHLNASFGGVDRTTDVLSFYLGPSACPDLPGVDTVAGEIYISLERARLQASEQQVSTSQEVARLFVHGLLHLAGFDHDTPDKLAVMERETDRFLQAADLFAASQIMDCPGGQC